jgi:hypothetical protein
MKSLQTMRCILCCNNPILVYNPKIQVRKGLTLYNTTNGIITSKKHMNANHFIIAKKFEEEVNSPLRGEVETTCQKNSNPSRSACQVFCYQRSFP